MRQIRKISIGNDYKTAMHYLVGKEVHGGNVIENIIEKDDSFLIYIRTLEGSVIEWKSILKTMPIVLEFNLDF